jgi:spore germination protein KA
MCYAGKIACEAGLMNLDTDEINEAINVCFNDFLSNRGSTSNSEEGQIVSHVRKFIEKNQFCPVSGIGVTQKPDIAAAKIMEGRVCVFCDGTPHVLYVPEMFIENIQSSEDYYQRTIFASFIRIVRFIGLAISVMLPGLAISIFTFNPEMLPPTFLINLIVATEKTPFPEAIEVIFLVLMLELLKESGTRLPKTLGSAVSIVGALIIGQAAVDAGLVGAPTVIVVALTSVASYIIPNLNEFTTVYKIVFLLLSTTFGLIGIGAGIIIMLTQLSATNSFGVPIMNFFQKEDFKDSFIRYPLSELKFRPSSIQRENYRRIKI